MTKLNDEEMKVVQKIVDGGHYIVDGKGNTIWLDELREKKQPSDFRIYIGEDVGGSMDGYPHRFVDFTYQKMGNTYLLEPFAKQFKNSTCRVDLSDVYLNFESIEKIYHEMIKSLKGTDSERKCAERIADKIHEGLKKEGFLTGINDMVTKQIKEIFVRIIESGGQE